MSELYYCPTAQEIEQRPGGGFDVCCDAPEKHEPLSPAALEAARRWAIAKVAKLHSAKPVPQPSHFTIWCDECQCAWPCHTAAILEGLT